MRRFFARLLNFAARRRGDDRLREEMDSHIAILTEENIRAGMTPEEGNRQARLSFGSLEVIREEYIAEKSLPFAELLVMDVRYALRVLWKSPAFTLVAIFTLMLGIGANVVVFGVMNAVLLRPLEVSDPQNLYQIRLKPWTSGQLLTTSYPGFQDLKKRNTTFSDMAAINAYSTASLSSRWGTLRQIHGCEVSGNYFELLGLIPQLGRFFHIRDENGPGSAPYVVLSNNLWRSAFDADGSVIGSTVELNHHPFTVMGVAPAQFHGTERFVWPDYWLPMINEQQVSGGYDYLHSRLAPPVTVIGRLNQGVSRDRATEDLTAIAASLAKEFPKTDRGVGLRLVRPGLFGDEGDVIRGFLLGVTVLALLVLAAACANLASLFAARAADRSRELALRVALGSSRSRLVRQLLTEAVILSMVGGVLGLVTANLLLGSLNRWHPSFGHLAVGPDFKVYLAGLVLALGSALLFGIVPSWQASRSSPLQIMKSAPIESIQLRGFALRELLLSSQITICTLLVAASLMAVCGLKSALRAPSLGFRPQGVMLANIDLGPNDQSGSVALQREKEMIQAAGGIPGAAEVGAINVLPMNGGTRGVPVFRIGTADLALSNAALTTRRFTISPGYLGAAGTRLLSGRDFSWRDTDRTPRVALVNATFARILWGEKPAVGQRFILWGHSTEVVGVVEDGKFHDLGEAPEAAVFEPMAQDPGDEIVMVVRSPLAPNDVASALHRVLSSIEPGATISLESWIDALGAVLLPARAAAAALGVIGFMAVMLALTGIFGMAAYGVSQRMKELGIRVALGASKMQLVAAAIGRPIKLLTIGSILGLLASALARPLLAQIVYQADPNDLAIACGAALTMALVGVVASALPAIRALAVDPAQLMREE